MKFLACHFPHIKFIATIWQKILIAFMAVTKISSCWVNTTSKQWIKRLGISFDFVFLLVSYECSWGSHFLLLGKSVASSHYQVSYHLLTNWWFVTAALSAHLAQICWVDAPDSDPGQTTIQGLVWSCWLSYISEFNPLSPNIHKQILQTDLYTFPYRISWEKLIKDQRFFSLWSFD